MNKKISILLGLAAFLVLTGFVPSQASIPRPFGILNMTFEKVYVFLEGQDVEKNYKLEANPGENEFAVLKGTYNFSYESCWTLANGTQYEGEIQVQGDDTVLTIDPCPGQPVPTKLAIYSHYEDPVTITFYGPLEHTDPEEFDVKVELGKTRYDAWSGTYTYTFEACDQTFSGELYVTKNGKTKFYLKSCAVKTVYDIFEEMAEVGSASSTAAKFRVANNFTSPVTVTLIGAQSYLLDVDPGLNRFYNIEPGTYTYIFGYEGQRYEGVITVGDSGETIFAIPFPVFAEGE